MKFELGGQMLFKNWQLKIFFITLFCPAGINAIQAQTITVTGSITSESQPLAGATVIVLGTNTGAITDFDGNYQITADSNSTLRVSYLGFITQDVKVSGRTTIDVVLVEDAAELDEVVVVGYGAQKKKEITAAVGQVKAETIVQNATSDLGNALQGQITGVSVTAQDGEPGAESNIVIRGVSSLIGSTSPLFVVDGISYDDDLLIESAPEIRP